MLANQTAELRFRHVNLSVMKYSYAAVRRALGLRLNVFNAGFLICIRRAQGKQSQGRTAILFSGTLSNGLGS